MHSDCYLIVWSNQGWGGASNHFKSAGGEKNIFLTRPNYLATLGFVIVIYLDEIIQHVMSFNHPRLEFCPFLQCPVRRQRVKIKGHAMTETPTVRPVPS